MLGARWYVLHDLVTLDIPDKTQPEHARLRIACNREGNRLTAGCDTVLELDLTYGDELRTVIGQFFGPENVPPEGPINVVLGGQEWTVDHSLHGELLGSLLVWQVEVELGDLLVQYPPDPGLTETRRRLRLSWSTRICKVQLIKAWRRSTEDDSR